MEVLNIKRTIKGERTLLIAVLLSSPGALVTGFAALTSQSATQLADFIRRTAELVASFVSWLVYHKLRKNSNSVEDSGARLEHLTNLTVAGAMGCSGIALFIVGVSRLFEFRASGSVIPGLIIAVLGMLTNGWFWHRYHTMGKKHPDPVIAAQKRLYRGKTCVDTCVAVTLAAVTILPDHPVTRYIDAIGTMAVALYLLYNGMDILLKLRKKEVLVNE